MTKLPPNPRNHKYVGRGHPPVEHRFKKGVSGNPAGRPKGRHCFVTQVKDELLKSITLPNGTEVSLAKMVASSLVSQVSRGKHTKPIELTLKIIDRAETLEGEKANNSEELEESKQAQLDAAIERIARKRKPNGDSE